MLTYAGTPLCIPTRRAAAWIGKNISILDIQEFRDVDFPSASIDGLTACLHLDPKSPIRLSHLYWPTGASRFGIGHFLADAGQLVTIRSLVASGNSNNYAPQDLVFDDGVNTVSTSMYMLPPRPLAQIPDVPSPLSQLYLLTLVDARAFWWEKAADITVTDGVTTWQDLIDAIATGLGETVTNDPIDAAYLTPSSTLTARYEYLPLLLDAVAYNIGMRVVRGLDGTVGLQLADSARTILQAQFALLDPKIAGGLFLTDASTFPNDLPGMLPANVLVAFPRSDNDDFHAVTVSLGSLSIAQFSGVQGRNTTKLFRDTREADFSGGGPTPANYAELQALAERIAIDW